MKSISEYIQEKLIIKKRKIVDYKYFPKTKKELQDIITRRIEQEGNEVDLNDIDVSNITDMSGLFKGTDFNGNISKWNVSNVTNMRYMFTESKTFNKDISKWDVLKVKDMGYMFYKCESFNQDISDWNVSNVTNMEGMFGVCKSFNKNISNWNVSKVEYMRWMFSGCKSFNKDISKWNISNVKLSNNMFDDCPIEEKYKPKFK